MLDSPNPASISLDLPPGDQIRILAVDDDEDDVVLIRELLESAGATTWTVDWCSTLEEGTHALHSQNYHACLVDMRLGASTGLDLVRSVASETSTVPTIVLTGLDSRETDLAAMEAGATDFISKIDLTGEKLERTIRYAIERGRARADLIRLARRDGLTGLHNRASIEERILHACARADRTGTIFGVALIDLDGFKEVNDSLGHAIGDQLLQHVARRLVAGVRQYDAVGRLGGDEFLVLLEDLDSDHFGMEIADRLVKDISAPYGIPGRPTVSASVGLAIYGGAGDTVQELIQKADAAMYASKRQGKAQASLYGYLEVIGGGQEGSKVVATVEPHPTRDFELEPQMDLRTRCTVGTELVPEGSPYHSTDVEQQLLLLREAQGILATTSSPTKCTVSVSVHAFLSADYFDQVQSIVRHCHSGQIEIELEGNELELLPYGEIDAVLSSVRKLNLRTRLGGFGVGKTLLWVAQLPFDAVCLHEDFSSNLQHPGIRAVVEGLVHAGQKCEVVVMARNVVSETQMDQLIALGVDQVQGQMQTLRCQQS